MNVPHVLAAGGIPDQPLRLLPIVKRGRLIRFRAARPAGGHDRIRVNPTAAIRARPDDQAT